MIRRVFTVASAISLLLCAVVLIMWIRSYWRNDFTGYVGHFRSYRDGQVPLTVGVNTYPGTIWFFIDDAMQTNAHPGFFRFAGPSEPLPHVLRLVPTGFGGFGYDVGEPLWLLIPYWPIAAASSVLPAAWLGKRSVASKRRRNGRCQICGYDLRASTDRCPECGTPIPVNAGAKP